MDLNDLIEAAIDEDLGERAECPACGGMGELLGTLGRRTHLRCASCGMDFSYEED